MSFPGRFADSLVVDQLDKLSVSFLVEDLEVRRGGCAANICFGLGNLGLRPVLVGAVGEDFAEYRAWLERHNVDCDSVHVSETRHTARFVCTNDSAHAQIASFYAGAMSESREIELKPIVDRVGAPDYVIIGPDDPQGMLRHTEECRQRGYPFLADPSQQLAFGDGDLIRPLIDGAEILFSNEYEASLITQKTGWSRRRGPVPRRHLGRHARPRRRTHRPRRRGVRRRRRGPRDREGRAHRGRRRVPRGLPGRPELGARPRARRPARLPARRLRRGAGRHPGVRDLPQRLPRALRGDVRRRGRRRLRAAPPDDPSVTPSRPQLTRRTTKRGAPSSAVSAPT